MKVPGLYLAFSEANLTGGWGHCYGSLTKMKFSAHLSAFAGSGGCRNIKMFLSCLSGVKQFLFKVFCLLVLWSERRGFCWD